jgi:hypothetical protein
MGHWLKRIYQASGKTATTRMASLVIFVKGISPLFNIATSAPCGRVPSPKSAGQPPIANSRGCLARIRVSARIDDIVEGLGSLSASAWLREGAGIMKTDVLIVGGGPDGAAMARFLVWGGIKPVILEQEVFPRAFTLGELPTG